MRKHSGSEQQSVSCMQVLVGLCTASTEVALRCQTLISHSSLPLMHPAAVVLLFVLQQSLLQFNE